MEMNYLRQTKILNDQVTVWMLPYRNLATYENMRRMRALLEIPDSDLLPADPATFALLEALTVRMEFAETLDFHAGMLAVFWKQRTASVTTNWPLALMYLSDTALQAWARAYDDTRDQDFAADDVLQAGDDSDPKGGNAASTG